MAAPLTHRVSKVVRSADSPSLWNYTISPGWTQEDIEVLRLAIMKYGLGSWARIYKSGCLPGKSAAQLNLQAQRIIGQQSLGEFMGIHLDPRDVWQVNNQKQGPEYVRKNGALINTGNVLTKEQRLKKHEENIKKYALSQEQVEAIVVPVSASKNLLTEYDKKAKLRKLKSVLGWMEDRLRQMEKLPGYDPNMVVEVPIRPLEPAKAVISSAPMRIVRTASLEDSGDSSDNNKNNAVAKKPSKAAPKAKTNRKPLKKKKKLDSDEEAEESMEEEDSDSFEVDSDFEEDKPKKKRGVKLATN